MKLYTPILIILAVLLLEIPASAQNYQERREQIKQEQQQLRSEIQNLENQIDEYQERLTLAEQKYDQLYSEYEELNRMIALQEDKLEKLNQEQAYIENEIAATENEIEENEEELEELIQNYKQTLSYLYKHGRTSRLALLLSAESINQMLIRSHYLGKFDEYREQQEKQINEQQEELEQNRKELQQAQERNEEVRLEIQEEYEDLEKQRAKQEENVALLRENKEDIEREIKRIEQERQELDTALEEAIAEEKSIRDALNSGDEGYLEDEEIADIENSFASEKGNLPWPVESTTISESFGERKHPVYGTVTPSLGIEIITEAGEEVRAVHSGKVISIQPFAGLGDVVMVQHGRFITAYGNLSEIEVSKNDILQQGQVIGKSGDENSVKGKSLFFLVRENNTNLDPETWLSSK